jgi:sentrin-specific protease 1
MGNGSADSVVSDASVMDTFDISLKKSDIWRLKGGEWLNDETINLYMKMIQKRGDDSKVQIHCFNSFFYELLTSCGYAKVSRWSRRKDMFAMDKLLFPVHLGNHWCLAIINVKNKRLEYYDSLGGGNEECFAVTKTRTNK